MAIEIPTTTLTTTTTVERTLDCNRMWLDTFNADGSSRGNGPAPVDAKLTPYAAAEDGSVVGFAGTSRTFKTRDVYAAARNVPAMGAGMGYLFAGLQAALAEEDARAVTLKTATAIAESAAAAVTTARANLAATAAARTAAYQARTSPTDKVWTDADETCNQATIAIQQAQAASDAAQANVTIATAAAADVANPALVIA